MCQQTNLNHDTSICEMLAQFCTVADEHAQGNSFILSVPPHPHKALPEPRRDLQDKDMRLAGQIHTRSTHHRPGPGIPPP